MSLGVLVMAHGTPSSVDGVAPFYTRIRHGRPPSEEQLAELVRRYEAIGGVSPLTDITSAQVAALRDELGRRAPGRYVVAYGAKYEPPLIEDGARNLSDAELERVVGLVLAPHASSMSTGQYMDRARAALGAIDFEAVGQWWDRPAFVDMSAGRVRDGLGRIAEPRRSDAVVIFTAHSLPTRVVTAGEDYPEQLSASAKLVAEAASLTDWRVAWQSAGRTGDEWLGPDVSEVVRSLAAAGVSDVLVCPIGFVADHLEVLYDIDIEARRAAAAVGVELRRTASANDSTDFVSLLADLVEEHS
jgi:ferrochelatase